MIVVLVLDENHRTGHLFMVSRTAEYVLSSDVRIFEDEDECEDEQEATCLSCRSNNLHTDADIVADGLGSFD
jgi:hypothetical protein